MWAPLLHEAIITFMDSGAFGKIEQDGHISVHQLHNYLNVRTHIADAYTSILVETDGIQAIREH